MLFMDLKSVLKQFYSISGVKWLLNNGHRTEIQPNLL